MKAIAAILLPGLDGTGEMFAPFVAAAPQGVRTIVVDYPTCKASIDVLDRCARERLTDRCIVIAESFSGPVGVRIAADDRVKALVLCNSFIENPMYIAVTLILSGWALVFHSRALWIYALAVGLTFHLRVVFGEEPWLARTHGEAWPHYKARVPRWLF